MAFFADLSECSYFPGDSSRLRAVGWLEHGKPYATGPCSPEALARLRRLLQAPWAPFDFMGPHLCSLCPAGSKRPAGVENLFIPAADCIFVCPELIAHYIEDHGYSPPPQFWAAVAACPPTSSPEYRAAIAALYDSRSRP